MKKIEPTQILIFSTILFFNLSAGLFAQDREGQDFLNRASQYYLGGKDEILVQVNIWGFIKKPGQYLVPRHTDLISLMSFAGGPMDGANLGEVRIIREGALSAGNNGHSGQGVKPPILKVNVKKYLETGRKNIIPNVEAGDTIVITESFGHKFRNVMGITSVVGLMAATATVIFAIDRL
ncbi:hypothetical protein GWO43_14805 [candidate division KSB1 bacterium]|nr:hypothetical protein [candidate division KSB1 bacterium]NIR73132.1 hypothetical protein [candidate division KSB1 bacterium]NIS25206.1 hypothetical protein [candidate division KSB1 bacterium]NIT72115.1 hypothetical protein [candidate division KSB1 bacterium]NIU25920.1 hypothetical protein [candidate division KSB1 bacterium]